MYLLRLITRETEVQMKLSIEIPANQQAIHLIDEMMKCYALTYDLPNQKELGFILHELVINAVEAMEKVGKSNEETIEVHIIHDWAYLQMVVIDQADGIPEEDWQEVLTYDIETMGDSDRGRGLFFIQHMVNQLWFEHVAPGKFLVGISKTLIIESQVGK